MHPAHAPAHAQATTSTFEVVFDRLTGRSQLRCLWLVCIAVAFLAAPVLAGELVGSVLGADAGLAVYRSGYLAELCAAVSAALLKRYV